MTILLVLLKDTSVQKVYSCFFLFSKENLGEMISFPDILWVCACKTSSYISNLKQQGPLKVQSFIDFFTKAILTLIQFCKGSVSFTIYPVSQHAQGQQLDCIWSEWDRTFINIMPTPVDTISCQNGRCEKRLVIRQDRLGLAGRHAISTRSKHCCFCTFCWCYKLRFSPASQCSSRGCSP